MSYPKKKYGSSVREVLVTTSRNAMGEYGKEVLRAGTARTATTAGDKFRQIVAIEDVELSAITDAEAFVDGGASDADNLIGVTIPAGATIFGAFSDIAISVGTLICYRESDEDKSFQYIPNT